MYNLIVEPYTPTQISHMITEISQKNIRTLLIIATGDIIITVFLIAYTYNMQKIVDKSSKSKSQWAKIAISIFVALFGLLICVNQESDTHSLQTAINNRAQKANQLSNQLERGSDMPSNLNLTVRGFKYTTHTPNTKTNTLGHYQSSNQTLSDFIPNNRIIFGLRKQLHQTTATNPKIKLQYTVSNEKHPSLILDSRGHIQTNTSLAKALQQQITSIKTHVQKYNNETVYAVITYQTSNDLNPAMLIAKVKPVNTVKVTRYTTPVTSHKIKTTITTN